MRDLRMRIAAFAIALGLGGLGGYAVSSSKTPQATTATLAQGTKVIRRTVHAKRPKAKATRHSHAAAWHALASTPVSTGSSGAGYSGSSSSRPVSTGTSGSSGPSSGGSHGPVHTGTSGASGGGSGHSPVSTVSSGSGSAGGGEGDRGGDHERGGD